MNNDRIIARTTSPNASAFTALAKHCDSLGAAAQVPPQRVLDRVPTRNDVRKYPAYYILGAGQDIAQATDCGHGYWLTDSCPGCDS